MFPAYATLAQRANIEQDLGSLFPFELSKRRRVCERLVAFLFLGARAQRSASGSRLPTSPEARGPVEVSARRKAGTDHGTTVADRGHGNSRRFPLAGIQKGRAGRWGGRRLPLADRSRDLG
jgi:hypothetical protein